MVALPQFERLAAIAMPAAPDVWVEAMSGQAECLRQFQRHAEAADVAHRVIDYASRVSLGNGRLGDSNRLAVAHSFLTLADIARLSLRVEVALIRDVLDQGRRWAEREMNTEEARALFELGDLYLSRNVLPLPTVIERIQDLLQRACQPDRAEARVVDVGALELTLLEAKIDSDTLRAAPTLSASRSQVPRWCRSTEKCLQAFWYWRRRQLGRARKALVEAGDIDTYPVLTSFRRFLEVLSTGDSEGPARLDQEVSDRAQRVERGVDGMGDLSTPLWELTLLLEDARTRTRARKWHLRPPESPSDSGPILSVLARALANERIRATLMSRGVTGDQMVQLRSLCERVAPVELADRELEVLAALRQAVRP